MNLIAFVWQKSTFLFDPVQHFFNGNFWDVFQARFGNYDKRKVVDIACGTGDLLNYIKPKAYLGIDINSSYINSNILKFKAQNINFMLIDATKFPIPNEYDTAFLISAVHHLSDQQIKNLCKNIKKSKVKIFIVVDGYPKGFFKGVLAWLDDFLAGGKYFRTEEQIAKIISPYLKIEQKGIFLAEGSFYDYPYVIARN